LLWLTPVFARSKTQVSHLHITTWQWSLLTTFTVPWSDCWCNGRFQQLAKSNTKMNLDTPWCTSVLDYHTFCTTFILTTTKQNTRTLFLQFCPPEPIPLPSTHFWYFYCCVLWSLFPQHLPQNLKDLLWSSTPFHNSRPLSHAWSVFSTIQKSSPCNRHAIPCSSNGVVCAAKINDGR